MKQIWDIEELATHWSLTFEEIKLLKTFASYQEPRLCGKSASTLKPMGSARTGSTIRSDAGDCPDDIARLYSSYCLTCARCLLSISAQRRTIRSKSAVLVTLFATSASPPLSAASGSIIRAMIACVLPSYSSR